ncbi:hypothetical protein Sste5346_007437 [Sporothrix stenoceras]|uniref:2EXR domain-containing protein n=1 Tax=Sporothrix stenoceras TaxID=5173 RepID=A0ABR3YV91_9PEZI
MRTEYVWGELYTAQREVMALEGAFHNLIVAARNADRPIMDETWMDVRFLFYPVYRSISNVQRSCVAHAELCRRVNRDKQRRQNEWSEARAAATRSLAAPAADGGAAGVDVESGADNGTAGTDGSDAHPVESGLAGPAVLEEEEPCSYSHYVAEREFYSLYSNADNIDNYYPDTLHTMKARAESKVGCKNAPQKLFPQFSNLPGELQLMIWERAVDPPPCSHILSTIELPRTDEDVAEALEFFPDAGLWKACPDSLKTVLRAHNKQKTRYAIADENGNLPECHGHIFNFGVTWKEWATEILFERYSRLPQSITQIQEELEDVENKLIELLRWTKVAVAKSREVLLSAVPDEDDFLAYFGPILHPEWKAHHSVPLLRVMRTTVNMCNEAPEAPTYSEDVIRKFDEDFGGPADTILLERQIVEDQVIFDPPPEIWNDTDPDMVPESVSGW